MLCTLEEQIACAANEKEPRYLSEAAVMGRLRDPDRLVMFHDEYARTIFNLTLIGITGRVRMAGDASTTYWGSDAALEAISRVLPSTIRLIVLLRDPVDRAVSQFHHDRRHGGARSADFPHAVEAELTLIEECLRAAGGAEGRFDACIADDAAERKRDRLPRRENLLLRGLYAERLTKWRDAVGDRLLVLWYEALRNAPVATLQAATRFLGIGGFEAGTPAFWCATGDPRPAQPVHPPPSLTIGSGT